MSDLSQMTPEQLAMTPAAMPPPGVIPNLVNPHTEAKLVIIISGALLLVMMLFFAGARYYMKIFVQRKTTPDDYSNFLAIIGTLWYYGTCVHAVTAGKLGLHMWDMSIAHIMSDEFLIASFFSNIISAPVWALAKTSFFLMYLHLFRPLNWVKWCSYMGLFVTWVFYILVFALSVYYQGPGIGQSWQDSFMNPRYTNIRHMTMPIAAMNLALDIYILAIPIFVSSNLQLTRSKRLRVIAVFGTGSLAVISSTLSIICKVLLSRHGDDFTYWVWPTLLLCLTEMTFGISCACVPCTAGFFQRQSGGGRFLTSLSRIFGVTSLRSSRHTKESSYAPSSENSLKQKHSLGLRGNSTRITANTYITIEHDSSSTHELTGVQAV